MILPLLVLFPAWLAAQPHLVQLNPNSIERHYQWLAERFPVAIETIERFQINFTGSDGFHAYRLSIPDALVTLFEARTDEIIAIQPDNKLKMLQVQVQQRTQTDAPWHLNRIVQRRLPLHSDFTALYIRDSGPMRLYVVDTGVNMNHVEFANASVDNVCQSTRVVPGYSTFQPDQKGMNDPNGHGTLVASVAAGLQYGVAKDAQIIPVQALDHNGDARVSDIIRALAWTIEDIRRFGRSRSVVNMSFGAPRSRTLNNLVDQAVAEGIMMVAAAGNEGTSACLESPSSSSAIAVGATDRKDSVASFSNTGSCVDIFAPGDQIQGAFAFENSDTSVDPRPAQQCSQKSNWIISEAGTSFSAPLVAGVLLQYMAYRSDRAQDAAKFAQDVRSELIQQSTKKALKNVGLFTSNALLYAFPAGLGVGQ